MELFLLLIGAGVVGYFIGRYRRNRTNQASSPQVVDAEAKDVEVNE